MPSDEQQPTDIAVSAEPTTDGARVAVASEPAGALQARARPLHMTVLAIAAPALGDQFLQMLLWWSDMRLAGGLQDATEMLAAVGMVGQLMMIVGVLFTALGVGAMALVARLIGAGDHTAANNVARQAIIVAVLTGAATAVVMGLAAPHVLWGLGLRDQTLAAAVLYARIVIPGLVLGAVMFMGGACLRGAGDTRGALLAAGVANCINIAVSWTLCKGWFGFPAMGLRGIAIGTLVAHLVGGLFMLHLVRSGRRGIHVRFRPLRFQFGLIGRVLRIGSFAGLESMIFACASTAVAAIIAHPPLGTGDYAAYMLAIRIEALSFLPGFAFGIAGGALVGQALGAGRPRQAMHYGLWSYALGGSLMTGVGLAFIFWPDIFVSIFLRPGDGPKTAANAATMLRLCGFVQPFLAMIMVFSASLKGAGDTRYPAAFTLLGVLFIRIPGAFLAARILPFGVVGVWCVMMSDLVIRGLLCTWRFVHGGWKKARV